MKQGTIYETATGQIHFTVVAPDEEGVKLQIDGRTGLAILFDEQVEGRTYYLPGGVATPRPRMPCTVDDGDQLLLDAGELLHVTGIPAGAELTHPAGRTVINDGFVSWVSDVPGTYRFSLRCFPYQEVTFDAVVG
jgi:hypothetical protein